MSVSLSVDGPGDAELISAVRGGDSDAYGELFARHVDAARRLARQLAGHADADDLVSDAFTKVLTVLQRGGGPDLAFRAYLLTAVRRLHVDRIRAGSRLRPVDDLTPFDPGLPFQDTAVEGFDNAAAARAFASLPERWQMVLWHTEVEQQKPADIAPLLGMSANSVSALAYRAREGLRQAFLSQHATDPDDVDCAWTRDHLGAYVRGGLSRRDAARVDDHLSACRACAAVYLELTEVNSGLAALLAPLLLGTAGASYLSSTGAGSSVLSTGMTAAKSWVATHASLTAVGGMVVAATAVLSIYGASQLGGGHNAADLGSPPVNRPPLSSVQPSDGGNPDGQNGHKTQGPGQNESPGPNASPTSSTPTQPDQSTTPVTDDSSAPPVEPSGPSTEPSGPTTSPIDAPPDLSFDSTPPVDPAIGSTYDVSATGGSGQISFSVDKDTTNFACSLAGHTVTFVHAGRCVITAEADAGRGPALAAAKASARKATQRIDVPQTKQKVSFETDEPQDARVDGSYDATATSTSKRHVTLSIGDDTTNGACQLSGSVVSFDHPGICQVVATQAGDADLASDTATRKFDVAKGIQAIDLEPEAPSTAIVGDSYEFTATGGRSGNDVVVSTNNADVCAVAGSSISFLSPGDCVITATQTGGSDYDDAPAVTQGVNVVAVAPETDLTVTATVTGEDQNWTYFRATVHDLPAHNRAKVMVTPEGNYALKPVAAADCEKVGAASYVCTVTSEAPYVDFTVNVHKDGRVIDFEVTAVDPLIDTDPKNNTFKLELDD